MKHLNKPVESTLFVSWDGQYFSVFISILKAQELKTPNFSWWNMVTSRRTHVFLPFSWWTQLNSSIFAMFCCGSSASVALPGATGRLQLGRGGDVHESMAGTDHDGVDQRRPAAAARCVAGGLRCGKKAPMSRWISVGIGERCGSDMKTGLKETWVKGNCWESSEILGSLSLEI